MVQWSKAPFTRGGPGSGLESGPNGGGPGDPDRDLDRLCLHGADSRTGSRKVVLCKRGLRPLLKSGLILKVVLTKK